MPCKKKYEKNRQPFLNKVLTNIRAKILLASVPPRSAPVSLHQHRNYIS